MGKIEGRLTPRFFNGAYEILKAPQKNIFLNILMELSDRTRIKYFYIRKNL